MTPACSHSQSVKFHQIRSEVNRNLKMNVSLVLGLLILYVSGIQSQEDGPPNIIFIMADDLGDVYIFLLLHI